MPEQRMPVMVELLYGTGSRGREAERRVLNLVTAASYKSSGAHPPGAPLVDPRAVSELTSEVPRPTAQLVPRPRIPKITLLLVLGYHFEGLVRDGVQCHRASRFRDPELVHVARRRHAGCR